MAKEYFSDLNYSLANEDTQIEYELLPRGKREVFCIAGSGSRVLPLLAKSPERVTVVDMSESQHYMTELRFQAVKSLTYEEWLFLLGYRGGLQKQGRREGDDRMDLFKRLDLSEKARTYWLDRASGWTGRGFLKLGKWERHFLKLGEIFRQYLQCDFSPIFEAQSLGEQIQAWEKHWPKIRFNSFVRLALSEFVFNKFLYKGHFAGSEGHRTESRAPSKFIEEEFHRLFHTQMARKSYFLQIMLLGEFRYEEGLPLEAHQHIFDGVKQSNSRLEYRVGNLLEVLPEKAWDFISLSDTVSYLDPGDANNLLQKLPSQIPAGAMMVIRSFMRAPTAMDQRGWEACPDLEKEAFQNDVTGVYQFHIFRKSG